MKQKYYTNERNVQIVISLLKQHGIKRVIASPGTTNMTFIGSIQNDPWFEIWSSVDERSAAYIACGMAAETGEPVVISCTGATASRNYYPGMTEAYYRKLPVLAITSHRGDYQIGHLIDQQIDRRQIAKDVALESVVVPLVKDANDEKYCTIEANKAILALTQNGGGPTHINMFTTYSQDFSVKELPPARAIFRHTLSDSLPALPSGRIGVFISSHRDFTKEETAAIDNFCASHDAVVFCDHTSSFYGKYAVHMSLPFAQRDLDTELKHLDLLIHIGEVSGDGYKEYQKRVWRVSEDGALRDSFNCLSDVFMMSEKSFFERYTTEGERKENYLNECLALYQEVYSKLTNIPFGNIRIAQHLSQRLPINSEIHFGIFNSLRSWNFFQLPEGVKGQCNVGGFGIDGAVSTMVGASLANPNRIVFGVFGDLAFFYDMNVIGNRHVGNNLRILLVNNGKGAEFRLYGHPCSIFGQEADAYLDAAGHFGNQSEKLVRHYAEDLGYEYRSASNEAEFESLVTWFTTPNITEKPLFLEVFTESENESVALEKVLHLASSPAGVFKNRIKATMTNIIGEKGKAVVKKLLRE